MREAQSVLSRNLRPSGGVDVKCVPYLGAVVGAIVALRFLAVAIVSPSRFRDITLLCLFVLAYAAVVFVALSRPLLMVAGTFAVSFAAISVLTPRLEGRT